jgi:flagellar biosynthesis protein FlhG
MARIVAVVGATAQAGTTRVALNLARCLAQLGQQVCVVSGGLDGRNPTAAPLPGFAELVRGRRSAGSLMLKIAEDLDLLPLLFSEDDLADYTDDPQTTLGGIMFDLPRYAFFLLDVPAGISRQSVSACLASTETILVVPPHPQALAGAFELVKALVLNGFHSPVTGVVNRVKSLKQGRDLLQSLNRSTVRHLELKVNVGPVIVNDTSLATRSPGVEESSWALFQNDAAKAIAEFANSICHRSSDGLGALDPGHFVDLYFTFLQGPLKLTPQRAKSASGGVAPRVHAQGQPPIKEEVKAQASKGEVKAQATQGEANAQATQEQVKARGTKAEANAQATQEQVKARGTKAEVNAQATQEQVKAQASKEQVKAQVSSVDGEDPLAAAVGNVARELKAIREELVVIRRLLQPGGVSAAAAPAETGDSAMIPLDLESYLRAHSRPSTAANNLDDHPIDSSKRDT